MAHNEWCGNACCDCINPCQLDMNMICSPDCEAINKFNIKDRIICIGCGADIIEVTNSQALVIIEQREPYGLFCLVDAAGLFIGIDNSTGDALTEEFKFKEDCFKWLYDIDDEDFI